MLCAPSCSAETGRPSKLQQLQQLPLPFWINSSPVWRLFLRRMFAEQMRKGLITDVVFDYLNCMIHSLIQQLICGLHCLRGGHGVCLCTTKLPTTWWVGREFLWKVIRLQRETQGCTLENVGLHLLAVCLLLHGLFTADWGKKNRKKALGISSCLTHSCRCLFLSLTFALFYISVYTPPHPDTPAIPEVTLSGKSLLACTPEAFCLQ